MEIDEREGREEMEGRGEDLPSDFFESTHGALDGNEALAF